MNEETKSNLEWLKEVALWLGLLLVTILVIAGVLCYCPAVLMKIGAVAQLAINGYILCKMWKKIFSKK